MLRAAGVIRPAARAARRRRRSASARAGQAACRPSLEAAAFIVHVGEDRQKRGLVKGNLNPAQDQRAVGIGHVKDHDADGVAALIAEGTREQLGR